MIFAFVRNCNSRVDEIIESIYSHPKFSSRHIHTLNFRFNKVCIGWNFESLIYCSKFSSRYFTGSNFSSRYITDSKFSSRYFTGSKISSRYFTTLNQRIEFLLPINHRIDILLPVNHRVENLWHEIFESNLQFRNLAIVTPWAVLLWWPIYQTLVWLIWILTSKC